MISLLSRLFIPKDADMPTVRSRYGYLCGGAGIFFNLLLFVSKLLIGTVSGSIAITADAFNNLSDAGSSGVTMAGFFLSSRKADNEHPYGHGRIEYLSGILISILIIYVGAELLRSSVEKILHPEDFHFSIAVVIVLVLSIAVKLYMAFYNRTCGKKIGSSTLLAASSDSLSDCISTGAVLGCSLFSYFTDIVIDGYVGVAISLLILWTGIRSVMDTVGPLLGQTPDPEFVKQIQAIVMRSPECRGIHDLMVHDYGPGHIFVSLHMEVDGTRDIYLLHDAVDLTEMEIARELGCQAVIHMDPIDAGNPILRDLYESVHRYVANMCPGADIHDFRMVPGPTHTNLIFDLVLPPEEFQKSAEYTERVRREIASREGNYHAVIKAEMSYIAHEKQS